MRDAFFCSAFQRIPWCGLGYQIHPFHRWVVLARHLSLSAPRLSPRIPQSIPLSPCGGFIGSDLLTLMGLTLCGLCLASTCAPYYSRSGSACQGGLRIFFADPRTSYLGVKLTGRLYLPLGVPSLGSQWASLGGVGVRVPPDMIIIPHLGSEVNTFFM